MQFKLPFDLPSIDFDGRPFVDYWEKLKYRRRLPELRSAKRIAAKAKLSRRDVPVYESEDTVPLASGDLVFARHAAGGEFVQRRNARVNALVSA